MAIVRWDPFSELNGLHEQVNALFNDTFGTFRGNSMVSPTTDVYSTDKELTIEAHLPNFKEEDITVQQRGNELEIKAEHQEKEEDKGREYLVRESTSKYYRRFSLPANSDGEHVNASFEGGVLKVTVPYKEIEQPKRIALQPGKSGKNQLSDKTDKK